MPVKEIHVGDIGTKFTATVKENGALVDLTGATTLQIRYKRPNKTRMEKTAVLVGAATLAKIRYTTVFGDINAAGGWAWQVYVVLPTGSWGSDWKYFSVADNI